MQTPRPQDPFCVTPHRMIFWRDFAEDVSRVRQTLMGHDAVCIMAGRRYPFSVLLAAAMLNGQRTVLPPARADGAVRQAVSAYAAPLVVDDFDDLTGAATRASDISGEDFARALARAKGDLEIFTSGSTGEPVAHRKTWVMLETGALLTAQIIARTGLAPGRCLVAGTTPHQHMYGLEASIFSGLAQRQVLYDTPVFYPADLEAVDERAADLGIEAIALITSPPHLKFLCEKIRALPRIRCVISATAPLSRELARQIDDGTAAEVYEIYGSTETGSLAWRRTIEGDLWTPLDGFQVLPGPDGWRAAAPHLPEITPLSDEIDLEPDGRFRLGGRLGDMVRIAGKRHSLGALNAILAARPEISDGAVLRESVGGEDRLHMFVVPREASADHRALVKAVKLGLRETLDGVFVPRRIHVVESLPRNETGKISARDSALLIANGAPGMDSASNVRALRLPKSG